jgi:hypothetical protein
MPTTAANSDRAYLVKGVLEIASFSHLNKLKKISSFPILI